MQLSLEQLKEGLREGSLAFCLPVAHAELAGDFLESFSERILKQDWREVSMYAHLPLRDLLADDDSEMDLLASLEENYSIHAGSLAERTLWEVMHWCAGASGRS